jgi:hypothetical protein
VLVEGITVVKVSDNKGFLMPLREAVNDDDKDLYDIFILITPFGLVPCVSNARCII